MQVVNCMGINCLENTRCSFVLIHTWNFVKHSFTSLFWVWQLLFWFWKDTRTGTGKHYFIYLIAMKTWKFFEGLKQLASSSVLKLSYVWYSNFAVEFLGLCTNLMVPQSLSNFMKLKFCIAWISHQNYSSTFNIAIGGNFGFKILLSALLPLIIIWELNSVSLWARPPDAT